METNENKSSSIEYEKLQAQVDRLTIELNTLKKKENHRRGRPPVDKKTKAKVIALYSRGYTMRYISGKTGLALGTVHKIINAARRESETAYMYMNKDMPATLIRACGLTQKVDIVNFTDDKLSCAFGVNENPGWQDYEDFLEYRCMPRTRFGLKEELKNLGVDSYDPVLIIEKTKGRLSDDQQWLEKLDGKLLDECEKIISGEKDPITRNLRLGALIKSRSAKQ